MEGMPDPVDANADARAGQEPFTCLDLLAERARQERGLEEAVVDHARGEVAFAFDPSKVSEAEIRDAARSLGPAMQASLRRSVLHLTGRGTEREGARAARALEARPGVRRAIASFVGGVVTVTFDPVQVAPEGLLADARERGLPLSSEEEARAARAAEEALRHGRPLERVRYWLGGERFERVLVALALGSMIAGGIVEYWGGMGPVAIVLYLVSYLTGGYFGTLSAYASLREGDVDIDLLMILAALGAALVGAPFEGAMLLFLFALSNVLQTYAMGRTRNAIEALARLRPRTAHVRRGENYEDLPLREVVVGDVMLLRPGEQVPLDAEVIEGESAVDQSSVTGESIPMNKGVGDPLFAGTQNLNGGLTARVTHSAQDSTLARMIALVEEAQARKAHTQRFLEATEKRYALGVILFTVFLSLSLPTVFGLSWEDGFYRAITVMVVASPCALVISTPASILSAIANGARHGILFKGGAQLEKAAQIQSVAFDKTGTLTEGQPAVVDTWCARAELREAELLALTAALEQRSEHPLAKAVVRHARAQGIELPPASEFSAEVGRGVSGTVRNHRLVVGSAGWVATRCRFPAAAGELVEQWRGQGRTVIATMLQGRENEEGLLLGLLAIADPVRPEARAVLEALRAAGIRRVAMLTGDNRAVAEAIARDIGLDEVYADLLPEDKVRLLRQIADDEEIAMVGDGTNDAPALASASLGIAMGAAGSDIAMESADVVLLSNDLTRVPHVLGLSRAARRIVWQNLLFAGGIIVLMVLATLFLPVLAPGYAVPLPIGVLAHEGGTVLVCLNGLRLLAWKP
jgi:Zn2+/Cd2+-exporting ATPase